MKRWFLAILLMFAMILLAAWQWGSNFPGILPSGVFVVGDLMCSQNTYGSGAVDCGVFTSTGSMFVASGQVLGWSSTAASNGTADTGLSRYSAGVVNVGNGTQGDTSGTMKATTFIGALTGTASGNVPTITLKKGSGAGNYTTSADTNYHDVDATNLSYTVVVPTGWKMSVAASGAISSITAVAPVQVALYDGATILELPVIPASTVSYSTFALNWVILGDGNSHTVKLQFKTTNGSDTATIQNASATNLPTMVFRLEYSN